MADNTQGIRTIMYSVVKGNVVTHRLPFNATTGFGLEKILKLQARGFTFDDPRLAVQTGLPQVIVTEEVDLGKPLDVGQEPEDALGGEDHKLPVVSVQVGAPFIPKVLVQKKAKRGRPRKKISNKKVVANA